MTTIAYCGSLEDAYRYQPESDVKFRYNIGRHQISA